MQCPKCGSENTIKKIVDLKKKVPTVFQFTIVCLFLSVFAGPLVIILWIVCVPIFLLTKLFSSSEKEFRICQSCGLKFDPVNNR